MSASHASPGFAAPDSSELAAHFPGYELEGLIATGGMGAVYCAVQKSLDRTVAIKILPLELSKDASFCAGFEAEAKAMARLNHPNLIGVYDFGEVNGMLFIIMEYVPGKSVYHSAYGRAIEATETIRLVTGICNGLAHAHENGILHRDIKPSNILLDLNVQPKIGDFGLARPIDWKIEEGEEIFGTPHYTAPEVVTAPHSVDYRADIFSVGVMLHELLTGKLPADDLRPASAIIHCDPRFDAIIKRATQPLPAARYSSAHEMAKELQAIGSSLGARVPRGNPQPGIHRTVKPARAHAPSASKKSSGAPIITVLVGLILAAVAYHFLHSKPPVEKQVDSPVIVAPVEETPGDKPPQPRETTTAPDAKDEPTPDGTPPVVDGNLPEEDPSKVGETPDETPAVDEGPAPVSNVPEFLGRARGIMLGKAKPLISVHSINLAANFTDFEKDLRKQVHKAKIDDARVATLLDPAIEKWKQSGHRVPQDPSGKFFDFPEAEAVRASYFQRQANFDDKLNQDLAVLSQTYIVGIEKQIERLEATKDVGAIRLLRNEIRETKESPNYFHDLMVGTPGAAGNE